MPSSGKLLSLDELGLDDSNGTEPAATTYLYKPAALPFSIYVPVTLTGNTTVAGLLAQVLHSDRTLAQYEWQDIAQLHISLTRDFSITYAVQDELLQQLRQVAHHSKLHSVVHRVVAMDAYQLYCNDSNSKLFIGLKVPTDSALYQRITALIKQIDTVLLQYKLPTFYAVADVHCSIAYCDISSNSFDRSLCDQQFSLQRSVQMMLSPRVDVRTGNQVHTLQLAQAR